MLLDYEHLYSSREEIYNRLINLHPTILVNKLLDNVFVSNRLNKKFAKNIISDLNNSNFTIDKIDLIKWHEHVPVSRSSEKNKNFIS